MSLSGDSEASINDPILGSARASTSVFTEHTINAGYAAVWSVLNFGSSSTAVASTSIPSTAIQVTTAGVRARLRIEWTRIGLAPVVTQRVEVDVDRDGRPELLTTAPSALVEIPIAVTSAPSTLDIFASVSLSISGTGNLGVFGNLSLSVIPDAVEVDVLSTGLCQVTGPFDVQANFFGGVDILPTVFSPDIVLLGGDRLLPRPFSFNPSSCPLDIFPEFAVLIGTQPLRLNGDPSLGTVYLQGAVVQLASSDVFPGRTYEVRF